jgi:hypothetical protein
MKWRDTVLSLALAFAAGSFLFFSCGQDDGAPAGVEEAPRVAMLAATTKCDAAPSCNAPDDHACYTGYVQAQCAGTVGAFDAQVGCPSAQRVGCCEDTRGGPSVAYYAPIEAATAASLCVNQLQGTWRAAP